MKDLLKNNPIYLRSCIVFEVASAKPIFDCYKNFCQKLGDDVMEYEEFHFWFMKFARNEMNLSYDRSQEPNYRTFSELPDKIMDAIFQKVTPKEVLLLRQVSKSVCSIVDNMEFKFNNVLIKFLYYGVTLDVNNQSIMKNVKGDYHHKDATFASEYTRKIKEAYCFLKNPNFKFKNFRLEALPYFGKDNKINDARNEYIKFIKVICHHVTSVKLQQDVEGLEVLNIIKPGTLREIHLGRHFRILEPNEFYNEIVKTEQWKQAKVFRCDGDMLFVKIEELSHFEDFQIRNWLRKDDDWEKLVNIFRTNPNFRRCRLIVNEFKYVSDFVHVNELFSPRELGFFKSAFGHVIEELPSENTYRQFLWKDGEKEFEIGMCDELIDIERKN